MCAAAEGAGRCAAGRLAGALPPEGDTPSTPPMAWTLSPPLPLLHLPLPFELKTHVVTTLLFHCSHDH